MEAYELAISAIGLLFLISLLYRKPDWKVRRKKYNIRKAKEVIDKLKSFDGDYREARSLSYLRKINPYVFEELLLTAFEKQGYVIERNKRYSNDGGIDGRIFKDGKVILIQAKRYKSYINIQHLQNFEKVISISGVDEGYFIHTGKTGKNSYNSYLGTNITIISGHKLIKLILKNT